MKNSALIVFVTLSLTSVACTTQNDNSSAIATSSETQTSPRLAQIHFHFELQDVGVPVDSIGCVVPDSLKFTMSTPELPGYYSVSVEPMQDVASNDHEIAKFCAEEIKAIDGVAADLWITNSSETALSPL